MEGVAEIAGSGPGLDMTARRYSDDGVRRHPRAWYSDSSPLHLGAAWIGHDLTFGVVAPEVQSMDGDLRQRTWIYSDGGGFFGRVGSLCW